MRSRIAFSLIEMLGVLAVLGAALTISTLMLATMIRSERLTRDTGDRLAWRGNLAAQFRDDVHATVALPEHWSAFNRTPSCLILQMPGDKHVVYDFRDGQLIRIEGAKRQRLPLPQKENVEFSVEGSRVILRLQSRPAQEIVAVWRVRP